ncbi:MAG: hypothetical protein WBZ29_05230 [Methanocella sp.]
MAKSVSDKISDVLSAKGYGLLQNEIARDIGTSPSYVRKITLVMEKRGLCRIVEHDRPRRIMIYPVEEPPRSENGA